MEKDLDLVLDVDHLDLLFDAIIYICVGTVLGRRPQSLVSKNMNSEVAQWIR